MKALVVDDEADVRAFLVECMEMAGNVEVDTAESGEEALGKAIQNRYDLVTLDIKMPGATGIDILSVIRGMMPWGVIAIISGYAEGISETVADHADLVLSKPVRSGKLRELVQLTKELSRKRDEIRALGDKV